VDLEGSLVLPDDPVPVTSDDGPGIGAADLFAAVLPPFFASTKTMLFVRI
jgi:hypothetical protein